MNPSDSLEQAIAAIKGGDKATGQNLLLSLLKSDPKNETALLWLSATTDDLTKKKKCFERVLAINPNNEQAKKALAALQQQQAPPPSVGEMQKIDTSRVDEQLPHPEPAPRPLITLEQETTKKCPYCAETIKAEATVCRFCGRDLATGQLPGQPQPVTARQVPQKKGSNPFLVIVLLLAVMCGLFMLCSVFSPFLGTSTRRAINEPPGPTRTPQIFEFNGRGDDTVRLTLGREGRVDFSIRHRGESNFIVEILDSRGRPEDLIVNEIGDYDGNRSANLDQGEHVIQITADGNWAMAVVVR